MNIVCLKGVEEGNQVALSIGTGGKLSFALRGSPNILSNMGLTGANITTLLMLGAGLPQPKHPVPDGTDLVFNEVSEPDSHPTALDRAERYCERANRPVINPPRIIRKWTRERVAESLQGIPGVIMPVTVRFRPTRPKDCFEAARSAGLEFPFIVRIAGHHLGRSMRLIRSPEDKTLLHAYPFEGQDFYLTQFVDYRHESGVHYKHRIVFVDGEPMARATNFDEHWNVHGASWEYMANRPELGTLASLATKLETETIDRVRPALDEIARRIDLDFFGLDCSVDRDGRLLVFEANANMDFLTYPVRDLDPWLDKIRVRLRKMVRDRV